MENVTMKIYLLLFFLLISSICYANPRIRPETWARPIIGTNLENLHAVDEGVFRSEQPGEEDISDLLALGIREVLNLREYHSDTDDLADENFLLHRIKINTGNITEEQIIEALRIIKNRKGPILIHCWHGSDRTGVMIAAYRIIFNNWSKSRALDEMTHGGYGYHAKIYPGLVGLIENLDQDRIRKLLDSSAGTDALISYTASSPSPDVHPSVTNRGFAEIHSTFSDGRDSSPPLFEIR
ncbi:MAG: tyrosine-protein phosphatase [Proteobacteria bacterium]|nr:tyrosine-protein phosphatase [Pseudomonadota bacterium]MBU1738455.1 tyrosine-protein phosphatase [Pseudomonadota bacterium]